jgi:hypothetical protein
MRIAAPWPVLRTAHQLPLHGIEVQVKFSLPTGRDSHRPRGTQISKLLDSLFVTPHIEVVEPSLPELAWDGFVFTKRKPELCRRSWYPLGAQPGRFRLLGMRSKSHANAETRPEASANEEAPPFVRSEQRTGRPGLYRFAQSKATPTATDYSRVKTRGGIIAPRSRKKYWDERKGRPTRGTEGL